MHFTPTPVGSIVLTDVLLESQGSKVCCICLLMSPTLLVSSKFYVEWSSFPEFWDGWIMRFYAFWQNLSVALNIISNSKFCLHFDWICYMKFQVNVWCYLAENDELMSGWNKNQRALLVILYMQKFHWLLINQLIPCPSAIVYFNFVTGLGLECTVDHLLLSSNSQKMSM